MKHLIKFAGGGNTRKSFNQMYRTARKAGVKYFNFNGKKYSTKMNVGEGKEDEAWGKMRDNAYDLDTGVNSFMLPTVEQEKERQAGLDFPNTSPKTDENIPRQYNNEFEQETQDEPPVTTKTIPGEWQPVLPEADRSDFRGDDEYKQGYIDSEYRYNPKTGKYYYDLSGNEPESVYRIYGPEHGSDAEREQDAIWYKEDKEREAQDMKNYYEKQKKEKEKERVGSKKTGGWIHV